MRESKLAVTTEALMVDILEASAIRPFVNGKNSGSCGCPEICLPNRLTGMPEHAYCDCPCHVEATGHLRSKGLT
jgi:hypothetical protein